MLLRLGVRECRESVLLELLTVELLADDRLEFILTERDKRLGVKLCALSGVSIGVDNPESFSADGPERTSCCGS